MMCILCFAALSWRCGRSCDEEGEGGGNVTGEMVNGLIPAGALFLFVCAFVHVRRTNPENKKIRTRISPKAMMRRQKCPRCGETMKKTWVKRSLGMPYIEQDTVYEQEAEPEFTCPECKYKIKAKF